MREKQYDFKNEMILVDAGRSSSMHWFGSLGHQKCSTTNTNYIPHIDLSPLVYIYCNKKANRSHRTFCEQQQKNRLQHLQINSNRFNFVWFLFPMSTAVLIIASHRKL